MKFIDANVFLFAALDDDRMGKAARAITDSITDSSPAATSALVMNEVFWNLRRPLGRERALQICQAAVNARGLEFLSIGSREWARALDLLGQYDWLKPNDALHAATASEHGIRVIVSADSDFDGVEGLRREGIE